MTKPGLLYIASWIEQPNLSEQDYDDWLNTDYIPRLVASSGSPVVLRCNNTHPNAGGRTSGDGGHSVHGGSFLTLVKLEDVQWMAQDSFQTQLLSSGDSRGHNIIRKSLGTEMRSYELVQRYEPRRKNKSRAQCIVAVNIDPAEGQDEDIDAWYRKEHLDALAENPIFMRATRYKLIPDGLGVYSTNTASKWLALHEYESAESLLRLAIEKGSLAPETEWTKRVLGNAREVERTIWKLAAVHGDSETRL